MATKQRRGVKDVETQPRQRLNVRVLETTYERLLVHCIKAKKQPGEFLDGLIEANCKEWRVQANPSSSVVQPDRRDIADELSVMATNAA